MGSLLKLPVSIGRTCLALFLITLASYSCAKSKVESLPKKDSAPFAAYSVQRVVDGDTVVLLMKGKKTKVRLIGVDTPETVHPQKPVEFYGKEASRFTKNLLKGEKVYIEYEPGSQFDKYGRVLGYLYRYPDGLFVNLEIVRQGYGRAYTRFPFRHMDLFKKYEKAAKKAGKGLWGPEARVVSRPSASGPATTVGPPAKKTKEVTVYITRTGKKYHQGNCRYLRKSAIPMSLKQARQYYGPCSVCRPPY